MSHIDILMSHTNITVITNVRYEMTCTNIAVIPNVQYKMTCTNITVISNYNMKFETNERNINKNKPTNYIYTYINVYYNYHTVNYLIIFH